MDEHDKGRGPDHWGIPRNSGTPISSMPRVSEIEEKMASELETLLKELVVTKREKIALLVLQLTYREMMNVAAEIQQIDDPGLEVRLDKWAHKVKQEMDDVRKQTEYRSNTTQGRSGDIDPDQRRTTVLSEVRRASDTTGRILDAARSGVEGVRYPTAGSGSERPLLQTSDSRRTEARQVDSQSKAPGGKEEQT